jgi:hypothetical protein
MEKEPIKLIELKHYGVKGMKWGVRRDRAKTARKSKSKAPSLSDKELKAAVARMNLEQQYDRLSGNNSTNPVVANGKKAVGYVFSQAGKQVVSTAISIAIAAKVAPHIREYFN